MPLSRDPYEVVLADLRAKRDEIDKAIRAIEAVRPPLSGQAGLFGPEKASQAPSAASSDLAGLSIEDGARAVLREKGAPMRPPEIAEAFREGGLAMNSVQPGNTVSSVLHRVWRSGSDIVLVKRGTWGLAEWYPDQDYSFKEGKDDAPENGEPEPAADAT